MNTGHIEHADQSVQLSRDRFMLCMQAVWELDGITKGMHSFISKLNDDSPEAFMLRALNYRANALSSALMTGLSDSVATLADLANQVDPVQANDQSGVAA